MQPTRLPPTNLPGSLLRDWLVASGVPDTAWVRISELLAGQPHLSIVTHPKIRSRKQLRINLRSLLAAAPAGAGAAAGSGACAAAAVPRADAGRAADGARDGGLQAWWRLEVGDKGVPRYSLAEAAPGSAGPPQPQAQVEAEVDEGLASMLPFLPDRCGDARRKQPHSALPALRMRGAGQRAL